MTLWVLGLNHQTAPVELRERAGDVLLALSSSFGDGEPPANGERFAEALRQAPALPGRVLWRTQPLPGTPWQLHLLHETHSSFADSRWAAAAGAGGWLALGATITDEASAMERAGFTVRMVEGRADNIKVTRPEDLSLAELFLQQQSARQQARPD